MTLSVPPRPALVAALSTSLALGALSCGRSAERVADLVLLDGRIVTLDDAVPEAEALAVVGDRIAAVGPTDEIRRWIGDRTRVIDLDGRLAIPGFIEAHGHLLGLGEFLRSVDLSGARSWDEVVDRVARVAATAPDGEWIVGRGWHQEKWDRDPEPRVEGFPVHDVLSAATPDHPVMLVHASGHASIVNAAAMRAASIDRSTPDPPGGAIVRDRAGRPTGVLHENAEGLVTAAIERDRAGRTPEQVRAEVERTLDLAIREAQAHGVTSFQDAGTSFETVEVLRAMAEDGRLGLRVWAMLSENDDALEERIEDHRIIGAGEDRLTVRAIKRYVDGALGNRGAWLLEPYSDRPETSGINTVPLEEIERAASIAREHGFQLCVHAIGDRGNREVLDIYERALAGSEDGRGLRWRIEHAQHLDPDDIPRFAALGVIASMQGVHCTSDGPWVPQRIGPTRAASGAYAWRSLLDSGATVCNGTDVPVEPIDPIANFHALVTRELADGSRFHPAQRMTREEALRASTLWAAYAAFEDEIKGSLTPGKLADVLVLSRDILTVPEDAVRDAGVVYTILGGEVVYGE